ncbi:MAG TPA: iron-only hydrogenase system regulator [Epulopiscium sp.]|nr:iron-only hydrogenase system regulator [Candidatus Epulonipiscium sp.]
MKKIAVISAILEEPTIIQNEFNEVVASFQNIVRGRMGLPFNEEKMSVVSLTVVGDLNEINSLTGKLGNIPHVTVKTAISKKEIQ